jgi:Tol biopolymer transport system component
MSRRYVMITMALLLTGCSAAPSRATQFRRVTSDSTRETDPAPSPDGRWLAFTSDRSGSNQIWIMPAGGGPARQLTFEPESIAVKDPARPDTIRTVSIRAATPTWAPDSKSLLFISSRTGRYNIYSVPLEGGASRTMASPIGNNRFAAYSPDGTKIAFYSNRLRPGEMFGFNIYVMDSAGESPEQMARQLTRSQGSPGHPTWSPDGRWIAYVAKSVDTTKTVTVGKGMEMKQNAIFARYKVWRSPAAGGKGERLSQAGADGDDYEDTWPSWSPADPRWIAVGRRVGTKQDVWIIDTTTGRGFPLTDTGNAGKPTWTRDGKSIYYALYGSDGNEDIGLATDLTLRPEGATEQNAPAGQPAQGQEKPAADGAGESTAK